MLADTGAAIAQTDDSEPLDVDRWHELVAEIGAEIAAPLTGALERILELTTTGRIDRGSLRALRDEVEQARRVGMIGQQLTRFASGRVRQSPERLQLAEVVQSTLAHRTREIQARGLELRPTLKPEDVVVDASLLFSLLNTTLDWALAHAYSYIEITIDRKPWPVHARLICRFAHRPPDQVKDDLAPGRLDTLVWRLVEQTAWTMGLIVERRDSAGVTTLTLEFPRTVSDIVEPVSVAELDDGFAQSSNSKALAGSHVLVIASRRELRVLVRDALRDMNLLIDFVSSIEEAASFCHEGLPHAIILESIQRGDRFIAFRNEIVAEVPDFVFIEILEEGSVFEMSGTHGTRMARVGRDVVANSLSAALMFELSKGL